MGRADFDSAVAELGLRPREALTPGPLTPLLAKGATLHPAAAGELVPGLEGTLGLFRYVGEGGSAYTYNAVLTAIPQSTGFVPRLMCERKGRMTDTVHYGFEIANTKLWTESAELCERFKISTSPFQDENWMRQLFAPSLIAFIAEHAAPDFSFELAYGTLLCTVEEDDPTSAELLRLWHTSAGIAAAVLEECAE